jgi:hypothetical protein
MEFLQYVAALAVIVVAMALVFKIVYIIADFAVFAIGGIAFLATAYAIHTQSLNGWWDTLAGAVAAGAIAGLICVPILPYTRRVRHEPKSGGNAGH